MRRRSLTSISLLSIALLLTVACASTLPSPRSSPVEPAVDRFVAALNNLDLAELERQLDPDANAFLPSPLLRQRIEGRTAIVAALTPLFDAERRRGSGPPYSHMKVQSLLIQRSGATAIATFDVGTAEVSSRRTLVFVLRGGEWRIVHFHASNMRPPGDG